MIFYKVLCVVVVVLANVVAVEGVDVVPAAVVVVPVAIEVVVVVAKNIFSAAFLRIPWELKKSVAGKGHQPKLLETFLRSCFSTNDKFFFSSCFVAFPCVRKNRHCFCLYVVTERLFCHTNF